MRQETLTLYHAALAALAGCPPEHGGNMETRIPGHGTRMICAACHRHHHKTTTELDARRKREGREDGARYWANRGIKPGDTVYLVGSGMFGPSRNKATAKVGVNGAYVSCSHWQTKGKQIRPGCAVVDGDTI